MPKLTDLFIDRLPRSQERITHWDTLLPAFGVRVGVRTKTFLVIDSAGSRKKIGTYGPMKLGEARQKARAIMGNADTRATRLLTADAISTYLAAIQVRPNTLKSYAHHLSKLEAAHGTKDLADLTPRQIAETVKTPQTYLAFSAFFKWCKRQAHLSTNPMEDLRPPAKVQSRTRVLSYDELKKIWAASQRIMPFNTIVRLCILTGQRRGELSLTQQKWYSDTLLTFPSSVTKNKHEHSIPLTNNSLKLLKQLGAPCRTWSKTKVKLDKDSGVTDWCIHDLRRTFATNLAQLGVQPHIIERLLNHASGAISPIAAIYNRYSFLPEMRAAVELYEVELVKRGVFS